jgi:hypothetical protein
MIEVMGAVAGHQDPETTILSKSLGDAVGKLLADTGPEHPVSVQGCVQKSHGILLGIIDAIVLVIHIPEAYGPTQEFGKQVLVAATIGAIVQDHELVIALCTARVPAVLIDPIVVARQHRYPGNLEVVCPALLHQGDAFE